METRTIKVYEYKELSPAARDRARQDFEAACGGANWFRESEYMASIKALAKHFGGKVMRYEIDYSNSVCPSWMNFEMPEAMGAMEIQLRLDNLGSFDPETLRGHGDCKLTGVCTDENAIDGFRKAFIKEGETDLNKLMQAAFKTWLSALLADYAYDFSDEGFAEMSEANEYRYLENGELWK